MNDVRWIRVAPREAVPAREGRSVRIGELELALFNLGSSADGETFLATDNQCPHKGGPLCDGILSGRAVVCPLHGWKINLETGAIERPDVVACEGVRTYPVRVDAGIVVIGVPNRVPEPQKIQNCHIVSA
jgi:nitrite reductase (NADH) small subunit